MQQLILEIQKDSNIDDNNRSKITSYSSDKVENIKEDLSSQIKDIKNDLGTNYAKKIEIGSPLIAKTSSEMVDTTKVYVYMGTEGGYIKGNWYIYNGTNWESGGTYNSQGIGDKEITREKLDDEINSILSVIDSSYIHDITFNYTNKNASANRGRVIGTPIPETGTIDKLKFVALNSGRIKFIILDKNEDLNFTVAKEYEYNNCVAGINEIYVNLNVTKGQYLGVWDYSGIFGVTPDIREQYYVCTSEPTLNTEQAFIQLTDGCPLLSYKYKTLVDSVGVILETENALKENVSELENILGAEKEGWYNSFDDIVNPADSSRNFSRIITPPFPYDGSLGKIKINVSDKGSIKLSTFNKNGNDFTEVNSATFNVGVGENDIKTNFEVKQGQYLGFYSKTVRIGTSTKRRQTYYTASGDSEKGVPITFTFRNGELMLLSYMYDGIVNTVNELKNNNYGDKLGTYSTDYNSTVVAGARPLYIQTPYPGALNQPYHPCVLYFDTAWNGYKYWMSESPFPKGANPYRDRYENPCIHCSNDGINWTTPIGLVNPIDDLIASEIANKDYMSDPHIVYRDDLDRIECWYRITYATDSNHTYILRKYSTDGVHWSEREIIYDCIDNGTNEMIRSQAVIWEDNKYKFLYTDRSEKVKYGEWDGSSNWTFNACTISDNKSIWHLDFGKNPTDNSYYMIAYSKKDSDVKYYRSDDKINWTYVKTLLTTGNDSTFWNSTLYRSCATYNGKEWLLYFTAEKDKRVAILGLMKGKTLDTLEVVDGGNNIESIRCNSNMIVNGEIILNGCKIGFDGTNLYFQRSDGTRLLICN